MITQIDPAEFKNASTVQIDSDAKTMHAALQDVEAWAASNGFVRTSEYSLRVVLVDGRLRYRGICFRISEDELAAMDILQRNAAERGEKLKGLIPEAARSLG